MRCRAATGGDGVVAAHLALLESATEGSDALVHIGHEFVEVGAVLALVDGAVWKKRSMSSVLPRPTPPQM